MVPWFHSRWLLLGPLSNEGRSLSRRYVLLRLFPLTPGEVLELQLRPKKFMLTIKLWLCEGVEGRLEAAMAKTGGRWRLWFVP